MIRGFVEIVPSLARILFIRRTHLGYQRAHLVLEGDVTLLVDDDVPRVRGTVRTKKTADEESHVDEPCSNVHVQCRHRLHTRTDFFLCVDGRASYTRQWMEKLSGAVGKAKIMATNVIAWTPQRGSGVIEHPVSVCEPVNLRAVRPPPTTYELLQHPVGLSSLQQETIQMTMESFDTRGAFLLGDATGVGKGRVIAGVIREFALRFGPDVRCAWFSASNKLHAQARLECDRLGVEHATPSSAVIFRSYAQLRFYSDEVVKWLRNGTRVLVVLDECHLIRNAKTITAQATMGVVNRIGDKVCILYSSATACSMPSHLSYLRGLGLFASEESAFSSASDLVHAARRARAPFMELVAMDMASRGAYVSRQLDMTDVLVEHMTCELSLQQRVTYDASTAHFQEQHVTLSTALERQSFFQRLLTTMKVDQVIQRAEYEIRAGNSVVVSLVNTGYAAERRRIVSVGEHASNVPVLPCLLMSSDHSVEMPVNALDRLSEHFGERMTELSNRPRRVIRDANGKLAYCRVRSIADEANDFVSGVKHIAVISRAAGTGISLGDRLDGRMRVHIVLELPWSSEDFLQVVGRTFRSDSIHRPRLVLVTTNVPAELRFTMSVMRKLRSLGALVKGDRNSCTDSYYNVHNTNEVSWSLAERRSVSLLFTMARLARDIPIQDAARCTRYVMTKTRAIMMCGARAHMSDNALKVHLIEKLRSHESSSDDFMKKQLMFVAIRLFAHDLSPLLGPWDVTRHAFFPHSFRVRVRTLFLCANSVETCRTLGALSRDMLFNIVEHMASSPSEDDVMRASRELDRCRLLDMHEIPVETILSRCLNVSIASQHTLIDAFEGVRSLSPPSNTIDIASYASKKCGVDVIATVVHSEECMFDMDVQGVRVRLQYTMKTSQFSDVPKDARFVCHALSTRVAWCAPNGVLTFSDGSIVDLGIGGELAGFVSSTRTAWEGEVQRRAAMIEHKIGKAHTVFEIATRRAIRLWETSCKKVVRVRTPDNTPVVGLLIRSQ